MHYKQLAVTVALLAFMANTPILAQDKVKPVPTKLVILNEAGSGKKVTLTKGISLVVNLPDNASTGFAWEATIPAVIKLKSANVDPPKDKMAVGGGTIKHFIFTGAKPGKGTLKLIYRRSFEKNVPPAKTFQVEVTVK